MRITIWGSRGSIPTPGRHTLRYGGNTTCLEIRPRRGGVIIVDAGSGIRLLGKKLLEEKSLAEMLLLLTHSHWDHLSGFPFFTPAYFARYRIRVYGGPNAQDSLRGYLSQQMTPPYFPVDFSVMKAAFCFGNDCADIMADGSVEIAPILLSHPNGGYGFRFREDGRTFVFLTDNEPAYPHHGGLSREQYLELCAGADLFLHDAQYTQDEYQTRRGWGHSTYADATRLALDAGVKRFGLFHHDPDRTDDDLERQVGFCRGLIRAAGRTTECFAAAEGMELEL